MFFNCIQVVIAVTTPTKSYNTLLIFFFWDSTSLLLTARFLQSRYPMWFENCFVGCTTINFISNLQLGVYLFQDLMNYAKQEHSRPPNVFVIHTNFCKVIEKLFFTIQKLFITFSILYSYWKKWFATKWKQKCSPHSLDINKFYTYRDSNLVLQNCSCLLSSITNWY